MMKATIKKWDTSEYLDSPEMIHEYLKAAFEEGGSELLMAAIGNADKAKGMSEIARGKNGARLDKIPTGCLFLWYLFPRKI